MAAAKRASPVARVQYTEPEKAQAFVIWVSTDYNMFRTSKDTGIPQSTIRNWIRDWKQEKNIPELEAVEQQVDDFIAEADIVRFRALRRIKEVLPEAGPQQLGSLVTVVGVLSDKIDRVKGLPNQRVQHTVDTTSVDATLSKFLDGLSELSKNREDELVITVADVVEQPVLGLPETKE